MTVTQAGKLSDEDREVVVTAMDWWEQAEKYRAHTRGIAVEMVGKSSYREVSRLTGFSTNTLQRWVREAGR